MSSPTRGAAPKAAATTTSTGTEPSTNAAPSKGAPKSDGKAVKRSAPVTTTPEGGPKRRTWIVRRVGLMSVLKVSIAFYLASVAMFVVALFALWAIAGTTGIIDNLEEFVADLFAYDEFRFVSWELFRAVLVLGVVWTALATTLTMIGAMFFNALSGMLGGVEVTLEEPS